MSTMKEMFDTLRTSLDQEPANPTMNKKLVINVAPTGAFTTREQNPSQPYTQEEIVKEVVESYQAGAAVWHVHCRDKNGIPNFSPGLMRETIDMVLEKCPDIITSDNVMGDLNKKGIELISPIVEPLTKAGLKYIRTAVVTTHPVWIPEKLTLPMDRSILTATVEYLQGKGVKPELQLHSYRAVNDANEWLIRPGILKKPCILNLVLGYHAHHVAGPTAPDPWGHIYLMAMMQTLPQVDGCVVGATIGGHNWLPMTVEAIMLGVDCVRIGMEDAIWMYPHRDEKIKRCADVVSKVATIARELGRDIATPAEARHILGV